MRWRARVDARSLRAKGRLWTLTTVAHSAPFVAAAAALGALRPITIPVDLILVAHAWAIPAIYAARGAHVLRPRGRRDGRRDGPAEQVAVGLLGDLLDHRARELHGRTGLVVEPGELGTWIVGEGGAILVPPGGRRLHCHCVKVKAGGASLLPPSDRIAHLLLALREDETGFATVANLVFSGAPWRVRRRLPAPARRALAEAIAIERRRWGR